MLQFYIFIEYLLKPGLIPCNESRRGSFGKENMNKEFRRGSAALIDVKPGVHDFCYIFTFVFSKPSEWIMRFSDIRYRLEICCDRHDGRSCKNISSCVNFSRKQRGSLSNLHRNMKFTQLFGNFTHISFKTIEIIHIHSSISTKEIINVHINPVLL